MRRLALCTLPLLGSLAVLVPATPAGTPRSGEIAAQPTVRVSPTTVAPGGTVTFTGRGWPAGKAVDLRIGPPFSEADHFAWARAGDNGRFRRTFRFSAGAEPGRYVVLACRRSCRLKAQTNLRIAR